MKSISNAAERDKIKALAASGDAEGIESAIHKGLLKRKHRKVMSVDRDAREIQFVVTADNVDRDSERILPSSLKQDLGYYLENPVVLFNHDFSIPAVGKMVDHEIGETEVTMTDRFAPDSHALAKVLWELYSADDPFMRMVSIQYIPIEWSNDEEDLLEGQKGLTYLRIEMFEHSFVNVGANRYALSKGWVPSTISTDPILKDVYCAIVEEPAKAGEAGGGGVSIPPERLESETKEVKKVASQKKNKRREASHHDDSDRTASRRIRRKSEEEVSLADQLNAAIGEDDRDDTIGDLAEASGIDTEDVEAILDGDVESLTPECLQDLAEALDTGAQPLIEAATAEGVLEADDDEVDDDDDEAIDDDDEKSFSSRRGRSKEMNTEKSRQKFYSLRGRIKNTYEERISNVQQAIRDHFEDNSDELGLEDDDYYYLDLDVIGTEETKVLFYCWNTGKAYKMDYEIDEDGMVELSNMSRIRFTYEQLPDDME